MIKNLIKKYNGQNLFLTLIIILATFLRLYRIEDYMTFLGDQGRDVLIVYNILHGHLTLLGPTSSVGGFFLGPIYYYFMAPFLWLFNYNPVGPAVMIALVGSLTVWLVYKFTSEFFNSKIGLIAATIYAISPVVVSYSRFSWNPNPMPFVSLLILYILYRNSLKNSLKKLLSIGLLLGIAMQLHYLATFLTVIIFAYVFLSEFVLSKTKLLNLILSVFKKYLFILAGFIVGWSPFLAFEIRHGFLDFKNIFAFVLHSGDTGASANYFQIINDVFFRLFSRLIFAFPDLNQISKFTPAVIDLWTLAVLAVALLSTFLLFWGLYKSLKTKSKEINKYLLLSCWFVIAILLFGFYKKSIYDYYFAFIFPLPFIMVGNFIYKLGNFKKSKLFLIVSGILFAGIFAINIQGMPFRYEPNRQVNQMKTIAKFVLDKTDNMPYNFALISEGNTDHAYRYFFTIWNKPPVTILNQQDDTNRKSVTNQLFIVCESPLPCHPLGNSLWEIAGFGRADIAGHWEVSVVEVYKLVHYKDK